MLIFFSIQKPGLVQKQKVDFLTSLDCGVFCSLFFGVFFCLVVWFFFEADCFSASFPKEKACVLLFYLSACFSLANLFQQPATEK